MGRASSSRCCCAAAEHRLGKIDDRLELLDGYIIAFLNLDRVIEIIRTEDEPKPVMMAEFGLTDRQAEAILNMRLRSLRRLEEMEIGKERDALAKEREGLAALLDEPGAPAHAAEEGSRRAARATTARRPRSAAPHAIEEAAPAREIRLEAMIETRADHRDPVAARLDPGDEGACRARPGRRR